MRGFRPLLAAIVALAFALEAGCDGWPSGSGNGPPARGTPQNTDGTCSGTPIPCAALSGTPCSSNAGCTDNGSCTGAATTPGQSCATRSPTVCAATPGCYWSGACTGTPYGTCSSFTESGCLIALGCIWTPRSTGSGGSSSMCASYLTACTTSTTCDCGFSCVRQCPTCSAVCGTVCLTDSDCVGSTAGGNVTPYCQVLQTGSNGLCSATR